MKVFICCEGVRDIGPLTSFIKRSSNLKSLDVECKTHKSIKGKKLYHQKISDNRVTMIKKLNILALLEGSNHIGYHQDADNNEFLFVYNAIKNDFINNVPNTVTVKTSTSTGS